MQHLVDGDRERVLVAEHGHGQRIADQGNIDAGLVDQARGRVVVGGEAGDGFVVKLLFADGGGSDLAARRISADGGETHCVLQCPSASWADRACARRSLTFNR